MFVLEIDNNISSGTLPNYYVEEKVMKLQLWLSNYPIPVLSLVAILLQVDPLSTMIPPSCSSAWSIIFFMIRATVIIIVVNQILQAVNALFIMGLIVVYSVNEAINLLRNVNSRGKNTFDQIRGIQLFRELWIWIDFTNLNFCNLVVPLLIGFGVLFVTFGLYGTIRMVHYAEFLVYLFVPITTWMSLLFVGILLPIGAGVFENSKIYLNQTGRNMGGVAWQKRVLRSLRPLGIQIGQFGLVSNSTTKTIITAIAENTATLLIMF